MGKYLNRAFPSHRVQLAAWRLLDADLDESCRHFEELSRLLEQRGVGSGAGHASPDDMSRSLERLRDEIRECVSQKRRRKQEINGS